MTTVRYLNRKLLRNIIRHTETHNRLREEDGMWQMKGQDAFGHRTRDHHHDRRPRRLQRDHDRLRESTGRIRRRGQDDVMKRRIREMNVEPRGFREQRDLDGERNRDIYRAQLGNQEKWGHNGFMELYPEEFISKESMDEMSDDDEEKKKRSTKKRKRQPDSSRKQRKSGEHKPSSSSDSSSESSDSSSSSSSSSASSNNPKMKSSQQSLRKHHSLKVDTRVRKDHRRTPSIDKTGVRDGMTYHRRAPFVDQEVPSQKRKRDARDGREAGKRQNRAEDVHKQKEPRKDEHRRQDDRHWASESKQLKEHRKSEKQRSERHREMNNKQSHNGTVMRNRDSKGRNESRHDSKGRSERDHSIKTDKKQRDSSVVKDRSHGLQSKADKIRHQSEKKHRTFEDSNHHEQPKHHKSLSKEKKGHDMDSKKERRERKK